MKINTDEVAIWDAYRKGDTKAFEQLYNLYYSKLTNYGFRFTDDSQYVEYALQDLFVKLWNNRNRVQSTTSVKNYLYVAFRRTIVRKLQTAREVLPFDDQVSELDFSFELSPESSIIQKERMQELQLKLKDALSKMNAKQREVIYLKYYEDLSYDEIAEIMDITVKGTYKLMYRAMDTLKENMSIFMLFVLYWVVLQLKK